MKHLFTYKSCNLASTGRS